MPQEHDNDLTDDDDAGNGEDEKVQISAKDLKALRSLARQAEKDGKALAQLRKESVFKDAGVDLAKPVGKLFFETFQGDLDKPDEIRKQAEDLGALVVPENSTTDTQTPTLGDDERRSTEERRDIATGGAPDTGKVAEPDPRIEAVRIARDELVKGRSEDDALATGIGVLVAAAAKGERRGVWDPQPLR